MPFSLYFREKSRGPHSIGDWVGPGAGLVGLVNYYWSLPAESVLVPSPLGPVRVLWRKEKFLSPAGNRTQTLKPVARCCAY